MDHGVFHSALQEQRQALGLSVEGLASLADVTVERVTTIEKGAPATTREISRLAKALAVDPAALWRGEVASTRTTARFRSVSGVAFLATEDATMLAFAAEAGRIAAHLSQSLGKPVSQVAAARRITPVEAWPDPWEQGYKLGAQARFRLSPLQEPIRSMGALLETLGVHVASVSFKTPEVLAASLYEPGAMPVILLNRVHPRVQQPLSRRAVLAHELCHLLHDSGETNLLTLISRGSDNGPQEQRANGFAPSFLVPGGWLKPHTTDARRLAIDVGTEWGLSFEGAGWHLKNAGVISNAEAEQLKLLPSTIPNGSFEEQPLRRSLDQLGLDVEIHPLANGLLSELALSANEAEIITRGRAIEILRLR